MKSVLLTIYAYSSFVSPWGPGPKLVGEFKKNCKCEVELKDMGDTNLFIDSFARKKNSRNVDLVLGLDQLSLKNAERKLAWKNLSTLKAKGLIGSEVHENFVAFDWAPLSFVYRKSELTNPPKTLDDLLDPRFKNQILLQDPRLSTPGLQFLAWVYLNKKEKTKEFLEKLKPQIHSIAPSWSTAYGLFKKKQAKLVFSYLSSPIYHWKEEKDEDIVSASFVEKHPLQTEWVGIPNSCKECSVAQDFVTFLMSDSSQKTLMDLNYMFPANPKLVAKSIFEKLPQVSTFTPQDYDNLNVEEMLKVWKAVFR